MAAGGVPDVSSPRSLAAASLGNPGAAEASQPEPPSGWVKKELVTRETAVVALPTPSRRSD